ASSRGVYGNCLRAMPVRLHGRGRTCGLCRTLDRPLQLNHVPGDLHDHSRTIDGIGGIDLGIPVLLDRWRRSNPAACRTGVTAHDLRDVVHRACSLLRGALPVRDRIPARANSPARGARGRDDPLSWNYGFTYGTQSPRMQIGPEIIAPISRPRTR